jgi:predicted anti-sigma-YlaC factor YlaD
MSPRTDLCDTCQHFRDGLHYNARQEEEAKDLLKRFKEHLSKAKVERNYYNKNTKLAEEQRKLVDQNYSLTKDKTQYCSIDATAHYSYD